MKKVLKYVLWAFLVVAGVTGLAVLGTVITKGFNPTKVYINSLTINGQKEYAVISDNDDSYTGRVDFLPAEANQLTLTAKIVTGNDVIEEITPVTAGQDFTIKFKKVPELDANNQVIPDSYITKGGEIEIKFVDSSQNAFATLKVLVDVGLKSNYVKVIDNSQGTRVLSTLAANNNTLSETVNIATSKKNQFKIECENSNMINSYKGAWTQSDINNVINPNRMKKILYFNSDDDKDINGVDLVTEKRVSDLSVTNINTATEKSYLFTYYSPYPTIRNGANDVKLATVSTYIYRTYYLESIFSETLANSIITSLKTNNYSDTALDYASINEFVNNYMYSRCSVAQKAILDKVVNKIGLVEFGINNAYNDRISALNEVLNFVFVRFNIEINVKNIKVVSINASPEVNFNVFEGGTFSVEDLTTDDTTNHLWVNLKADNSNVDNDVLKANLRNVEIIVCKKLLNDDDVNVPEENKFTFTDSATQTQIAAQIIDDMTLKVNKTTENGVTKWEFNPMVNTFTGNDYFLVYKYQNEVENVTLVTLTSKGAGSRTDWYYRFSEGWKIFNGSDFITPANLQNVIKVLDGEEESNTYTRNKYTYSYNITSGIWKNEITSLDVNNQDSNEYKALKYLFENSGTTIYGYSPYKVNYKEGSIYFNKSSEAFVLNTARWIYKRNTDLVESKVTGLNRGSKQYGLDDLAGTFKDSTMTYKTIKWVVKKLDNMEDEKYYKLLPTFRRIVDGEAEKYNEITYKFKYALTGVNYSEGNGAGAEEEYEFMEVGTTYVDNGTTKSTFNLRALNVLDGSMELYAFVVQTLADGTPYTTKEGEYTYLYYASNAPAKQKITIDNYVDNLYAYATVDVYKDGQLKDKNQFTCVSDRSAATGHNANDVVLEALEGSDTTFYLSSCKLQKNGETIEDYTENNRLYLKDIVCYDENGNKITVGTSENYKVVRDKYINVTKNEQQAMKNFVGVSATNAKESNSYTFNDEVIKIANIEEDGNIEATITLKFEFDASAPYLKVTINTSVSSAIPVYSLKVFTNAPQSSEKMYSDIKDDTTGESIGGVEFYIKPKKTQVENA